MKHLYTSFYNTVMINKIIMHYVAGGLQRFALIEIHFLFHSIFVFVFKSQCSRTLVCTDPLQNVSSEAFLPLLSAQGILFCTSECLKAPPDLLKIYLHESNRVYRDKLVEEKDFQLFDKLQADAVKKFYEVRILKYKQTKMQGWRKRERIICLPALCLDLDISIQPRKSKQKETLGWRFRQGVGGNVNQCGTGVLLSESALSAGQIGKHFNGFLLTSLPSTLPGCKHAH